MFMEFTSPNKSSLYELSVIMAISDVVSAHAENKNKIYRVISCVL